MLVLVNLRIAVFKEYHTKIFHSPICIYCISSVARQNKCSKFNVNSVFVFLSKHKTLCKLNFLEHFSNKDLKTLLRQLNHELS